ncbi:tRNA-splicing endonuclease subunit Sen15 isoform X2 [Rhineura floridana]|uniref:tRNA-splicing endonuclease subunit Sen15 isoform X2 n=1 Tax=Rhineura floridana TaxID=261503 RepID=UPI002AC88784|nr:tRNA-splicing endonuclease subunit Sen15 isoform X2 [Rhineura floridana]XP_061490038.1 tRNA-splicing endonuclease subunit Sen15 isoform X2 [Rhineura floridana]XP_061490039.1 tRNA-splicing endonuclease subunit Sen15 isoform X2 [Rhineura floridana]
METPGSSSSEHGATGDGASLLGGSGLSAQEEDAPKCERWALRENWLAVHPTLTRMMSLDVADSSCVYAAFLVYLDLLEVRKWHEVSYVGLAEFQLVCLHGCVGEAEGLQVVVPIPIHVSFSHERMRQIMKRACTVQDKPDSPPSMTLAIVESDSTIVYYKLTDGFVTPDPPDDIEDMDDMQWRKKRKRSLRR